MCAVSVKTLPPEIETSEKATQVGSRTMRPGSGAYDQSQGNNEGRQRSTSNTCAETKKGKIGRKERKKDGQSCCLYEGERRKKEGGQLP